ncbi:MAG: cache domain-containing protein [Desulfuromonadaceae bacterium]|nr:cache domain-containing protein [Desulfuromonadaceae bacterium]
MHPIRFSIRLKLTIGALLPLFVAILVCSLAGIYTINSSIVRQAQEKVRTDLNSAREVYLSEVAHIRDVVTLTANAPSTATAFSSGRLSDLSSLLSSLRAGERLDILSAVAPNGRVLFRARNPGVSGDKGSGERLVERALAGQVVAGTALFSHEELLREGGDLARQATIEIIETPRARPSDKHVGRSGMLLVSSAPVKDSAGRIIGALYGGILLNGNNNLVDKIKRIVYEGVQYQGEDAGTATMFLDDLRINTNVHNSGGGRAIGTRLSEEVYNHVIVNKKKWVDPAFVVRDWYFSAYEPILDLDGKVIGSLYVGMLGKPYAALKQKVTLIFVGVLFFGSLIGFAVSGFIGSHLSRPIRELQDLVRRFSAGEREVRIEVTTGDEIGNLAAEFNEMTKTLIQREEEIKKLNRDLERKVLERTAELEDKNQLLVKAKEDLVRVEKLAAVGALAAGVAHEINNPMAIIRGNAELLQMAIPADSPSREEADTIARQVGRVERIVASLLQFARRERKYLAKTDLNPLLEEILAQVGHQVPLAGIYVRKEFTNDLPQVSGDADQLRQVFTNLILNGVQAMPDGGVLTVATEEDVPSEACVVIISDTGGGIEPENLEQIFNPFFTTKSNGTGLGLSVSYGIVKDHGGKIEVTSELGSGSIFRVRLPMAQPTG